MQALKNKGGYGYELNAGAVLQLHAPRQTRQFVLVGDCAESINNAVLKEPDGKQKGFLCFGQGQRGFLLSDLDECAHVLIAGSTGSGKSVLLNSLIMQLLCYSSAQLLLIDHKSGAELLNKGDALVRLATSSELVRVQAPFITDAEILACITGKHDKK